MFPNNINDETIDSNIESQNNKYKTISDNVKIYKTPGWNFETQNTTLINGDILLLDDYQNVRNWIILFLKTPIDIYKIYEGTGFGTSIYKLKGYKNISGILYAQIKKEIEDGFLLNPNIKNVESVELTKEKNTLSIYVKVKLADGYILEEKTEVYNIKE